MPHKKSSIPILGLLTWSPMSGYEIKTTIEKTLGNFWSESYGQLYPQLRALNKVDYIEEIEAPQKNSKRPLRVYQITDKGHDFLVQYLAESPHDRPPRNELLLKMFFASESDPLVIIGHCQKAREQKKKELERYQKIQADLRQMTLSNDKAHYWLKTVNLGVANCQAFISWCDDVIADLSARLAKTQANVKNNQ